VSAPAHANPQIAQIRHEIRRTTVQERYLKREIRQVPVVRAALDREIHHIPGYPKLRVAVMRVVRRQKLQHIARLSALHARVERLLALLVPPPPPPVSVAVAPAPEPGATAQAAVAIAYAVSKIGDPYVWGATGPSTFDCSGLTQAAWAAAGVTIPRDTYEQVAALPAVSRADLQPGDLLFFDGNAHVAIYVGGGMLIDAPHTGAVVEKVPFAGWFAEALDAIARP
jgi:cell wall-associated NlpC family hydrolase